MDVLGLVDVLVIDYKTQELHVRFRGPQVDPDENARLQYGIASLSPGYSC